MMNAEANYSPIRKDNGNFLGKSYNKVNMILTTFSEISSIKTYNNLKPATETKRPN